jgi:hypothetical protein
MPLIEQKSTLYHRDTKLQNSQLPKSLRRLDGPEPQLPKSLRRLDPGEMPLEETDIDIEGRTVPRGTKTPDTGLKGAIRSGIQPLIGFLETTLPNVIATIAQFGGELDSEELGDIANAYALAGKEFDIDKFEADYSKGLQEARETFPTVQNISRILEEATGAPLQAQTKGQQLLRSAGAGYKLTPGAARQKLTGAIATPATQVGLEQAGVPEPVAEFGAAVAGPTIGASLPFRTKTPLTKPSGMPERRFEDIRGDRRVKPETKSAIRSDIENDFRSIADKIVEESPVGKTVREIQKDPGFIKTVEEQFDKVKDLAKELDTPASTKRIKKSLIDNVAKKKAKGFVPSEYERLYEREVNRFLKQTPNKDIDATTLIEQYRKNNKQLGEFYESGRSYAYNRAKKDALLDANRAIADTIKEVYPDSQFSRLFEESNKAWTEISNAEAVTGFIDDLFEAGKIDYRKAKKFFNSEKLQRPFIKGLGRENFNAFEQTLKDMLKTEKPYKLLKTAAQDGILGKGEMALYYAAPKVALARTGKNAVQKTFRSLMEASLEKPKILKTWQSGYKALKKGDVAKAVGIVEQLDEEVKEALKD